MGALLLGAPDARAAAAPALVQPAPQQGVAQPWTPAMDAARQFAQGRQGRIAFAVRTPTRAWHWHGADRFPSASVLKAMLLVGYLRRSEVREHAIEPSERQRLSRMIRRSDNPAANRFARIVGVAGLQRLARRAGMRRFAARYPAWGESRISAPDQVRFMQRIDGLIPRRHRRFAMELLETIVPSQRWGIAEVAPRGWRLYFKGGWGTGTGLIDHQVALLTFGRQRVSIAILTQDNGSHDYGKQTLRGIAELLLGGLGPGVAAP